MCCFSGTVQAVNGTQIFARLGSDNRQFLIYEMSYQAKEPVAMVLPLPVAPGMDENAVRFHNLQGYPTLFTDLLSAFGIRAGAGYAGAGGGGGGRTLAVQAVGDFVASYVPTQADFVRLDPRFRLPKSSFRALPHYANWGYAVFQLQQSPRQVTRVHPMALSFPVRESGKLFFPTVHIHDGKVHQTEYFDHTLYAQWDGPTGRGTLQSLYPRSPWGKSKGNPAESVDIAKAQGIVDARLPLHRRQLRGNLPNRDTWLLPTDLT